MNIGVLIPQIFYDCIARITPGLTVLCTIILIWWPELESFRILLMKSIIKSAFFTGTAIILASYITALILEGMRYFLSEIDKYIYTRKDECENASKKKWEECLEKFKITPNIPSDFEAAQVNEGIAINLIRMEIPEAGSRIVKLRAEVGLFHALAYGWLFIMLSYIVFIFLSNFVVEKDCHSLIKSIVIFCSLGFGITCIEFRRRNIEEKHLFALYNHWLMIITRKEKDKIIITNEVKTGK